MFKADKSEVFSSSKSMWMKMLHFAGNFEKKFSPRSLPYLPARLRQVPQPPEVAVDDGLSEKMGVPSTNPLPAMLPKVPMPLDPIENAIESIVFVLESYRDEDLNVLLAMTKDPLEASLIRKIFNLSRRRRNKSHVQRKK